MRYVTDTNIQKRMIALVITELSTGQAFVDLVKRILEKMDSNVANCVGNATDGAANMQGEDRGFSALLSADAPQVHVCCYSHVLNLVLMDATSSDLSSASLFNLLNDIAQFFCETHTKE